MKGPAQTRKLVGAGRAKVRIVSGISRRLDTVAHETEVESGGETSGVIGRPLCDVDRRANGRLSVCSRGSLLISPVPSCSTRTGKPRHRLSSTSAGRQCRDGDGHHHRRGREFLATVNQAEAAMQQGRKHVILNGA